MALERHDEAVAEARRALALDPASSILSRELGFRLHLAGRYEDSIEQFRKTLELDPYFTSVHLFLANVYWDNEMREEALAEAEYISESQRTVFTLVAQGKEAEAVAWIDDFAKDGANRRGLSELYARAGDKDKALDHLEEAFRKRTPNLPITLSRPSYDPWRSDPRLVALLNKMGLEP
jgi:tetratricopeptide (TPR) repeat protein